MLAQRLVTAARGVKGDRAQVPPIGLAKLRLVAANTEIGKVGIWTREFDNIPSSEAQGWAASLEELGIGTVWIPEIVGRDPLVTAALLLSATSTLKVATGIVNIYARDPMTT